MTSPKSVCVGSEAGADHEPLVFLECMWFDRKTSTEVGRSD